MVVRRILFFKIVLILVVTAGVAWWSQHQVARLVEARELNRLEGHVARLADRLETLVQRSDADTVALAGSAEVISVARAPGDASIRDRAEATFRAQLEAKPWILQLRVIEASDQGRELVRLDRSGEEGSIRAVPEGGLQAKGERPYVRDGRALAKGEVLRTALELNEEFGQVVDPPQPVIRSVAPVFDGSIMTGLVVINIDMGRVFREATSLLEDSGRIFVLDGSGRTILDPVAGFYPGTDTSWIEGMNERATGIIVDGTGERVGVARTSTTLAPNVVLLETVPFAEMTAFSGAGWRAAATAGVIVLVGSLFPFALLIRSIIR
ncbi:MAG: hypothetical protein KDA28_16600, partial [Phycisphaerales bacterium]|nr:hypothetical protein [Phycisphaerales bacterium]